MSVDRPGTDGSRPLWVTATEDGPEIVEGPVDIEMPDGTVVHSDRRFVALCTCRRSKIAPFCDTSHRARTRATPRETHG